MKIDQNYFNAYKNLAIISEKTGEFEKTIKNYNHLLELDPDEQSILYNFSIFLSRFIPLKIDEKLSQNILKILSSNVTVRPNAMIKTILNSLIIDHKFNELLSMTFPIDSENIEKTCSIILEFPILIKFMEITTIPFISIEILLTNLRKNILLNLDKIKNKEKLLKFQISLALQCHVNEYIFNYDAHELLLIKDLEDNLFESQNSNGYLDSSELLCLASYKSLYDCNWLDINKIPDNLTLIKKRQILEVVEEKNIRPTIISINKSNNHISQIVKKQYEDNPYPRWIKTQCLLKPSSVNQIVFDLNLSVNNAIHSLNPQILVAGCGTGQHAIMTSTRFLNSKVIAIDLSYNSLSYALRKTKELGLNNISYMQADINNLSNLNKNFDIIESVGVLHHMDDPVSGLNNLVNLLKKDGLMKIGLYSKLGRQRLENAKKYINKENVKDHVKFRQSLYLKQNKIFNDLIDHDEFYSSSQLKDLLFHPKEYAYTIPEIKKILKDLNLKFCGFENSDIKSNLNFKKRFNQKSDLYCLDRWDLFEQNNPNTFSGMYQFWIQKQ